MGNKTVGMKKKLSSLFNVLVVFEFWYKKSHEPNIQPLSAPRFIFAIQNKTMRKSLLKFHERKK